MKSDSLLTSFPPQFSSGLLETITGISSKVCPSAPAGRARLCLWCGTRWPRTGCMFSVKAGITSAMTGTGRLTGVQEIIWATWPTWLWWMEVRSWGVWPWGWEGPEPRACRCGGDAVGDLYLIDWFCIWLTDPVLGLFVLTCCLGFDWVGSLLRTRVPLSRLPQLPVVLQPWPSCYLLVWAWKSLIFPTLVQEEDNSRLVDLVCQPCLCVLTQGAADLALVHCSSALTPPCCFVF